MFMYVLAGLKRVSVKRYGQTPLAEGSIGVIEVVRSCKKGECVGERVGQRRSKKKHLFGGS